MFIEKRKSGSFLFKRIFQKKVSLKISENRITKELLEKLTHKECELVFAKENYKDFVKEIFNLEVLKYIIFKSIFIQNTIDL